MPLKPRAKPGHAGHRLQNQQLVLPGPGRGLQYGGNGLTAHPGNRYNVHLVRVNIGQPITQPEGNLFTLPVLPGGLSGPAQRSLPQIGGDGTFNRTAHQQPHRQIAMVSPYIGQPRPLRHLPGNGVKSG